jgi:hypothetical protein
MDFWAELGGGILGNTISAIIWLLIIYYLVAPRVRLTAKIERHENRNRYRVGYWNAGRRTLINVQFRAWVRWREDSGRIKTHELLTDEAERVILPRCSEAKKLTVVYPVFAWKSLEELCGKRGNIPFREDLNLLQELMAGTDGREEAVLIATVAAVHPLSGFQRVVKQTYGPSDVMEVNKKVKTGRNIC